MYLLPGLALLRWCYPAHWLTRAEQVALALGIGAGLPPLLLELAHLLHIPWSGWTTWGYAGLAALAWLWPQDGAGWRSQFAARLRPLGWHGTLLIGLTAMAVLVRLYAVRAMPVGAWGDSVHHTLLAKLLVEKHGLFSSWQPYVPLASLNYHFGFHSNAAFLHWLTGISVEQSVLLVGQLLNAWSAALAYALTVRLSGLRIAGLWAMALTAFVNIQPAFYVNWGRYTQLTGQVVLVAVLITWMLAIEHSTWRWRTLLPAIITSTGLFLSHYLVTIWAAVFLSAYLLVVVAVYPRWSMLKQVVGRSALIGVGVGLLSLPWMLNLLAVKRVLKLANGIVSGRSATVAENAALAALAPAYLKSWMIALMALGLLIALGQRRWRMLLCGLWTLLLLLLVIPFVLGLPLAGLVTGFAANIGIYVVAIPLAGYALGALIDILATQILPPLLAWRYKLIGPRWIGGTLYGLASALLIAVSLWGLSWQRHIVDPMFELFTPADAVAMDWINANTAPDATFLVTMLPAYAGNVFVGDDGGWWIPYFTKRKTTVPPLIYGSEVAEDPTYFQQVNALGNALKTHPLPTPEGIQIALDAGIDYIYVGPHIRPNTDYLRHDYQAMRYMPEQFPIVYERDGVVIYQLRPGS